MSTKLPVDELVTQLLEHCPELILDHDEGLGVYILPAIIPDGEPDCGPYPRLEYQVSNGLPGQRASSVDCDTYEEAKKEYAEMLEEARVRA